MADAPSASIPDPTGAMALQPASGRFLAGVHHFPVRVYFEDTDLSGVVYHTNYLRFMERARSDMLRVAGINQRAAQESGEGVYAVSEVAIRYLKPARLDDDLIVKSHVAQVSAVRCEIAQHIWRGETQLTSAAVTAVFLDPAGRPRRQPAPWVALFTQLAQRTPPAP